MRILLSRCCVQGSVLFLLSSPGRCPSAQQLLAAVSLPSHGCFQEAVTPQVPPAIFSCLPSGL